MKRDDFIGNKFDGAMDKLMESIVEMRELSALTGDQNFLIFAELLNSVVVMAQNNDMKEFLMLHVMPFVEKKAEAEQAEADLPSDLPQEIKDLLKGLNGPDKLN